MKEELVGLKFIDEDLSILTAADHNLILILLGLKVQDDTVWQILKLNWFKSFFEEIFMSKILHINTMQWIIQVSSFFYLNGFPIRLFKPFLSDASFDRLDTSDHQVGNGKTNFSQKTQFCSICNVT